MNKSIYLNEEEVNIILDKLNTKKQELINLIDNQKKLHEKMHLIWGGTSGEKAFEALKKHEKRYESYLNAINKRIKFLNAVKNAYLGLDNYLYKKIDSMEKTEM